MKWLVRVVLALLVIVILASGAAVIIFSSWSGEFDRKIAHLEERGAPLSPGDFTSPPVPPDENGAPLYMEAFELLKSFDPEDPDLGSLMEEPVELEKLAEVLQSRTRVLEKLREASSRSACRFESDPSKGYHNELPFAKWRKKGSGPPPSRSRIP